MAFVITGHEHENQVEIASSGRLEGSLCLTGDGASVRIAAPAEKAQLAITAGSSCHISISEGVRLAACTITVGRDAHLEIGPNADLTEITTLNVPDYGRLSLSDGCTITSTAPLHAQQSWIAAVPTRLKIAPIDSGFLSYSEKLAVPAGARLSGQICHDTPEYWLIEHAMIDGAPVPPELRFALKAHWNPAPLCALQPITEAELVGQFWQVTTDNKPSADIPLVFERNGRLSGHRVSDATRWTLLEGELRLLNASGQILWRFYPEAEILSGLSAQGDRCSLSPWRSTASTARSAAAAEDGGDAAPHDDRVKLVIWDLDDTFWHGTLAEGDITPIAANIELVKSLSARGIVNSICSKNHFEPAKMKLEELGVWEHFIFPRIAFQPKGAMIQDIIATAQLRAPSVLFIDDNPLNINEAKHYCPDLQIAMPDILPMLLDDHRVKGKPDPDLTRLARYKIRESKVAHQAISSGDNLDFLRQSGIRISFHHDVETEFARIHDLVNRTNQLNFTKRRWSEDETEARASFASELLASFNTHCGYVKVADRYGSYGICGFYLVRSQRCVHFLFSCRTINMGIEQFVWHRIGRPDLKVVGEVVARLGELPDWITIVEDVDNETPPGMKRAIHAAKPSICVRGACDLSMMSHYLRMHYDIQEEFPFPYQGWGIHPVARAVPLQHEAETPEGAALLAQLPGFPPGRFISAVNSREADVYVLSFSSELFCGQYRSRSTGMLLPLQHAGLDGKNFSKTSFSALQSKHSVAFTEAQWHFMQKDLVFEGGILDTEAQLAADVRYIMDTLRGKIVIVLMLNSHVGQDRWILDCFSKVNDIVRPIVEEFRCDIIDLNTLVRGVEDLVTPDDGGAHFHRHVYTHLADLVSNIVDARFRSSQNTILSSDLIA